ncbi:Ig-like domain-containing protein, partial [Rahnella ecdela]
SGHWVFQMTAPFQPTFGNRIITATATDAAGNTSAASDSYVVNYVDTNMDDKPTPGTPSIFAAEETYDDGSTFGVYGGATIDDSTPRLFGEAEAGSIVRVYDESGLRGSVIADSKGVWIYEISRELADGKHTFTATAMHSGGHASAHSAGFVLNVITASASGSEDFDTVGNDIFGTNEIVHLSSGLKITAEGATKNTSAPT